MYDKQSLKTPCLLSLVRVPELQRLRPGPKKAIAYTVSIAVGILSLCLVLCAALNVLPDVTPSPSSPGSRASKSPVAFLHMIFPALGSHGIGCGEERRCRNLSLMFGPVGVKMPVFGLSPGRIADLTARFRVQIRPHAQGSYYSAHLTWLLFLWLLLLLLRSRVSHMPLRGSAMKHKQ